MTTSAPVATTVDDPSILESLADHFARNLIGGRWQFPAAPYEFEIRSPVDSRILAVVPLSSRFDVATAIDAGRAAAHGAWADRGERMRHVHRLVDALAARVPELAAVQAAETGLRLDDSQAAVLRTVDELRSLAIAEPLPTGRGGVSGHILSWGLPFTEVTTSVWLPLLRGEAVVVKPSLRAPLSATAFGRIATECGLPAGVLNIVQGTGGDVGAELIGRRDLVGLHVRAGERTIAAAERSRTSVPLRVVRAGGSVCLVGPELRDVDRLGEHVRTLVRMNSAGGPFGLPLLAVQTRRAAAVIETVVDALTGVAAAPLPSEPLRGRCLEGIRTLEGSGAVALLGGDRIPDDIPHRMGWRVPPVVLALGMPDSRAAATAKQLVPLGPVLGIVTYEDPSDLSAMLATPRAGDGTAWVWGMDPETVAGLPQRSVIRCDEPGNEADPLRMPPRWTGGADERHR